MKRLYITTPIYYVNDIPHIGHAYTSIICDTIKRFYLLKGFDVRFLTGTDEHGLKVEKAANNKGLSPKKFVDEISNNFINLTKFLNLLNDDFIRTTEARHKKSVEEFWNKLLENNQIYLDKYKGWYSIRDESFFQEKELIKVKDKFQTTDGGFVEWIEEESYFFKLSKWEKKLLDYYEKNPNFIKPESRRNEVISFVKSGLKDLSISRTSFNWGIKVPNSEKHIIYVWIDALTNYLTAINFPNITRNDLEFWKNSYHIIGKDILKFHAVYWPALLMAIDFPLPKTIFAHGWWTNEGKKISKSAKNTIEPNKLISKFGLDQVRYFLIREVTLGQDGDFSEQAFINRTNSDLSNSLGNLVSRTIKLTNKYFDNKFPSEINKNTFNSSILITGYELLEKFEENIINFELNKGLEKVWFFISQLNQFIDKMEPWATIKNDRDKTAVTLSIIIESIRLIGIILQPFIPTAAKKILDILNIDNDKRSFKFYNMKYLIKKDHPLNDAEPLFPRLNV